MLNFFKSKNSIGKVLQEVDKKLNELEVQVENLLQSDKSQSQKQKILNVITKDMDSLYKTMFDLKTFNMLVFEYIVEKNIINLLTSYVGLQNLDLIKLVIPLVDKILFDSKDFYDKIEVAEEILWMNSSVVNSLKILIHTMKSFLVDIPYDENLVCSLTTFLHKILNKLGLYPNFYFAISSSNFISSGSTECYFDSVLFEIIIELFSLEHSIENREVKAKLRKSLLLCLNLDNFYTIQIIYVEKLIEYLVNNLVCYYEKYKNFDTDKLLGDKQTQILIKKEKISSQDFIALNSSDIISYLKYFSMLLHCFSQPEIKKYLSNLLFNKLLIEQIQKDILNIYVTSDSEKRIYKVAEFIFYFTKYVRNKETSQIIFYFFFGFNDYTPSTEEFYLSDEEEEETQKIELDDLSPCEENLVNLGKINIDNLIKNNFSSKLNLNVNIDKTSHKFENILAFLMTILEASFNNMSNIKITFINILKNIVKNTPNLFMSEVLVPYYVNYLNNQTKSFDKIYDKIRSSRDKINVIEIVKNIHPKYFPVDLDDWSDYFENSLEKNYQRNIWLLENAEVSETQEENDLNILNDDECSGNLFLDNNSGTPRKLDSDLDTTSPSLFERHKEDSSRSFNINFSNITYVTRIRFYDTLVKCFKNFVTNPYHENLYLTSLFTEIFSLPYSGDKIEAAYNIYSNMTFAIKKKFILFNVSSVGLVSHITNRLDEVVKIKYTKEDIVKLIYSRVNEKYTNSSTANRNTINNININKSNLKISENVKDGLFIDNLVLFLEFYKEYISNIFTKCYFDQINFNYTRASNNLN